jgi:hypothetical protein
MKDPFNDIPATLLSELTVVLRYKGSKCMRYLDKMHSFLMLQQLLRSSSCAFNDLSTPPPPNYELNVSINVSQLITSGYCNSCYNVITFSYTNTCKIIIIIYVYLN